jgi:hypothetical protein
MKPPCVHMIVGGTFGSWVSACGEDWVMYPAEWWQDVSCRRCRMTETFWAELSEDEQGKVKALQKAGKTFHEALDAVADD